MLDEVVVIGAGGFGRETLDVIEAHNATRADQAIRVVGIVDDSPSATNLERLDARGYTYVGTISQALDRRSPIAYVLGVGGPHAKREIAARMDGAGWQPLGVVHPAAVISPTARIDEGVIVCGGVQVSTNARLARHVHLNPNATVGHDAVLESFTSVNPGAVVSGETRIHAGALIGAGAVVLQGLTIGAGATVGAASCVTKDVIEGITVVGVPARPHAGRAGERR